MLVIPNTIKLLSLMKVFEYIEAIIGLDFHINKTAGQYEVSMSQEEFTALNDQLSITTNYRGHYVHIA